MVQQLTLTEVPLIIGLAVAFTINIPQLYKTFQTHDVAGFSSTTILLRVLNNMCWLWYSVLIAEWVIVATSTFNALSELALLAMKTKWHKDESYITRNEVVTAAA